MKPAPQKPARKTVSRRSAPRCLFSTSDRLQCTMLRWESHPSFCLFHARREQQLLELDRIGAELASLSGEFKTASDVNHDLGKLFSLAAQNRNPPRHTAALAYVGKLLLHSLPRIRREITDAQGFAPGTRPSGALFSHNPE